jgi:NAD(P)-dependent dehydrogenase (short-subunit alcohol dehydrogenase family)
MPSSSSDCRASRMRFQGKVALLTGAGGGVGRAIGEALGREGADLILVDNVEEAMAPLATTLREAGRRVLEVPADVTVKSDIALVIERAKAEFERIDVLVNNAGVVGVHQLEIYPEEAFDRVLAVNLKGPFLVSQAVGRTMIAAGGGAIVNVTSLAGHTPSPGSVAYSVSKAGLIMLTRQTALEWGPHGIRCNAVSPGATSWAMGGLDQHADAVAASGRVIPLGRAATPDDVGSVVAFLASDDARHVSGQALGVDGGFSSALLTYLQREMGFEVETAEWSRPT